MENKILDNKKINKIIKRLAYQILEGNLKSDEIILIGIFKNGYEIAKKIKIELNEICDVNVELLFVKIDKKSPLEKVVFEKDIEYFKNKSIVLVDDVLNTGKTLIYCVKNLLEVELNNFKTVVLIDRNHKKYPVKVDYKGISLSTSMNDHVELVIKNNNNYAVINWKY